MLNVTGCDLGDGSPLLAQHFPWESLFASDITKYTIGADALIGIAWIHGMAAGFITKLKGFEFPASTIQKRH